MKKYLVATLIFLAACSHAGSSKPIGPASQVLKEYYYAIQASDTAKTYTLSTTDRAGYLRQNAQQYFAMCYKYRDSLEMLGERQTSDSVTEVRYKATQYDRTTGQNLGSGIVECTMIMENGKWKVSQCHEPDQAAK